MATPKSKPLIVQALPYIQFLLLAAIFCVIISLTTKFYAVNYPFDSFSTLPLNSSTILLSVFNAYSEQIPQGATPNQIGSNLGQFEQSASSDANTTIFLFILATIVIIEYNIVSKASGAHKPKPQNVEKRNDILAGMISLYFINSLLLSQYLLAWLNAGSLGGFVGVSLFKVDSVATILFFSIMTIRAALRKPGLGGQSKAVFGILNIVPLAASLYLLLYYMGFISLSILVNPQSYFILYFGLLVYAALYTVLYISSNAFLSKVYRVKNQNK